MLLRLTDALRFNHLRRWRGTLEERHGAKVEPAREKKKKTSRSTGNLPTANQSSRQLLVPSSLQTSRPTARSVSAARNFILASESSGFTKPVGCTWTHSRSMVFAPSILIASPVQCSPFVVRRWTIRCQLQTNRERATWRTTTHTPRRCLPGDPILSNTSARRNIRFR